MSISNRDVDAKNAETEAAPIRTAALFGGNEHARRFEHHDAVGRAEHVERHDGFALSCIVQRFMHASEGNPE